MSEKLKLADIDVKFLIDRGMAAIILLGLFLFARDQGAQWIATQNKLIAAMVATNTDTNNRWTEIRISENEQFADYQLKQQEMLTTMKRDNELSSEISKTLVRILERMVDSEERAMIEALKTRLHDQQITLPDPPDIR